jgi:hypothetical protein
MAQHIMPQQGGGVREWLMRAVLKAVQVEVHEVWGRAPKALRERILAGSAVEYLRLRTPVGVDRGGHGMAGNGADSVAIR